MNKPIPLDTIMSELDENVDAWVLQDADSKNYLTIPDPRYPGKNPIRFFLRQDDAEAILMEVLEVNEKLKDKEIYPVKVKLIPALKSIATDKTSGHADSFVVHSPNEVYEWVREQD